MVDFWIGGDRSAGGLCGIVSSADESVAGDLCSEYLGICGFVFWSEVGRSRVRLISGSVCGGVRIEFIREDLQSTGVDPVESGDVDLGTWFVGLSQFYGASGSRDGSGRRLCI